MHSSSLVLVATILSHYGPTVSAAAAAACDPSDNGDTCRDEPVVPPYEAPAPYKAFETSQLASSRHKGDFGRLLDAGTGADSLRWLASLFEAHGGGASLDSYTAVTADEGMRRRVSEQARQLGIAGKGQVVIGNWMDGVKKTTGELHFRKNKSDGILLHAGNETEMYDTILADYLIGAMDKFSPYHQDVVFRRLARHLRPGGRLLVLGMEPVPDAGRGAARVAADVARARDAAALLAGERPYREYPLGWVERALAKEEGLTVVERRVYPYRHTHDKLAAQIGVGRGHARRIPSEELRAAMTRALDDLEAESLRVTQGLKGGAFISGFNYIVIAEKDREA